MKTTRIGHWTLGAALSLGSLAACAHNPPPELISARAAYTRAAGGPAATLAPAQLDDAKQALARAEKAYVDNPGDKETRDYGYIAERQAMLAEVKASISRAENEKKNAQLQLAKKTQSELKQTKEQLAESQKAHQLSQQEMELRAQKIESEKAMTAQQLEAEKKARADAEAKAKLAEEEAKKAMADLAKIASVKEEARGTVISLAGGVLFGTGKSALLPGAMSRLDQIATVLTKGEPKAITIEGHTDSVGSDATNQELSQRRADSVKQYLTSRGVPAERMTAVGLGKSRPVDDNSTAEGRANNRRVEMILARPTS